MPWWSILLLLALLAIAIKTFFYPGSHVERRRVEYISKEVHFFRTRWLACTIPIQPKHDFPVIPFDHDATAPDMTIVKIREKDFDILMDAKRSREEVSMHCTTRWFCFPFVYRVIVHSKPAKKKEKTCPQ